MTRGRAAISRQADPLFCNTMMPLTDLRSDFPSNHLRAIYPDLRRNQFEQPTTVRNLQELRQMDQPTEAQLWANQSAIATAALNFAITFLGCRMGSNNQDLLDANAVQRLLTIFRAVSYVESVHGTQGDPSNQPAR